jgi:hypothetical protein
MSLIRITAKNFCSRIRDKIGLFSIGDMFEVGCLWLRCLEMPRPRPQQFSVKIFTSVILLAHLQPFISESILWVYIYREIYR